MKQLKLKNQRRRRRHWHIRKQVNGTPEKPRLNIFRSNKHIYCQLIDDSFVDKHGNRCGKTMVACSTLTPAVRETMKYGGNVKSAEAIGAKIAELAKAKGITTVAFDRGGYKYHGRVKALADAARKNGLTFQRQGDLYAASQATR